MRVLLTVGQVDRDPVHDRPERSGVGNEDRDVDAVELFRDESTDHDDVVGFAEDDPGWAHPGADRLREHGGARRGASTGRHDQDRPGHDGAPLGMARYDDLAGRGVEPAPEAERLVEDERGTRRPALDEDPTIHQPPQTIWSRSTWPAAAERTHSSRLPRATSNPRLL